MKLNRRLLREMIAQEMGLLSERGMIGNIVVPGIDPETSQKVIDALYANPDIELWLKTDLDAQRGSYKGEIDMLKEAGRKLLSDYNTMAQEVGMDMLHMGIFDDIEFRPPPGSAGRAPSIEPGDGY